MNIQLINLTPLWIGLIVFVAFIVFLIILGVYLAKHTDVKNIKLNNEAYIKKEAPGERDVTYLLSQIDPRVVQNYYPKVSKGYSTEIDNILVCRKGIFVIETKCWNGLIIGDEYSEEVIVEDSYGHRKTQKNPYLQNEKHVHVIKKYFPDYELYINNVVVMVENNSVGFISACIVNFQDLYQYIMRRSDVLDDEEVTEIYARLEEIRDKEMTHEKHVENIRQRYGNN